MADSTDSSFLHDWVIRSISEKYSRLYTEIQINPGDEKNYEYNGTYPDAVFINYDQVIQIVEVETAEEVNKDRVEHWKNMSELGAQLLILVPKSSEKEIRNLSFDSGLAAKVKIGTFDVDIKI